MKNGSARKVRRRFQHKFQDATVPHKKTVHRIGNKCRQTRSLLNEKRTKKPK
jgi:hypothetical protein